MKPQQKLKQKHLDGKTDLESNQIYDINILIYIFS